jgi:hypothetical protein
LRNEERAVWLLVVVGLLVLIYAFGLRLEENRNEHTVIQNRIDRLEQRLNKEKQVDSFVRELEANGIRFMKE